MENQTEDFNVGHMVEPINNDHTLRSGAGYYSSAVVVSVEPFILVSIGADMKWSSTVVPEGFKIVGIANEETLNKCLERI